MFGRERRQLVLQARNCSFLEVVWNAVLAVDYYCPESTCLTISFEMVGFP